MSEFITREELLAARPRRYVTVHLPVSGGKARLQSLTELERETWDAGNEDAKGNWSPAKAKEGRRRLIAMALVDGEGRPLLAATADDVAALRALDAVDLRLLWEAAAAHCLGTDLERLKKSLAETPGDDSP